MVDVHQELELIGRALRPGAMAPRLARALGLNPLGPCGVLDAKYEARQRATVLYHHGPNLVSASISFQAVPALANAAAQGSSGEAILIETGMAAFVFPHDPDLANLATVLEPTRLGPLLSEALGDTVLHCRPKLLRYRPGTRATIGIDAQIRTDSGPRRTRLIAKIYRNTTKAAAVFDETRRLSGLDTGDGLVLAEPVAYLPALPMTLQMPVTGVPLDQLVTARLLGKRDARLKPGLQAAARAMATLHTLPAVSVRQRSVGKELDRFADRATRIAAVDPACGRRLLAVIALLADQFDQLPAAALGLVHGDCKPSQFLTRHGGVALLDFDHCGVSDPAADVGAFTAALRKAAVVGSLSAQSNQLEEDFLETYLEHAANQGELAKRASWHQAASLVRKALRAFARAPRSPLVLLLADEATIVLTSGDAHG